MDCKETQMLITRYIRNDLNDDELIQFMEHIGECQECYDELEIYFMVNQTLKRLDAEDDDREKSYNVQKELRDKLMESRGRIRRIQLFRIICHSMMVLAQVFLLLILLSQFHLWQSEDFQKNAVYRMVYERYQEADETETGNDVAIEETEKKEMSHE